MQKKISIVLFSMLFTAILLTGFLSLSLLRSNHIYDLEEKLISNGRLIGQYLKNDINLLQSKEDLQKSIEGFGDAIDARITLIDSDGNVLADSMSKGTAIENHRDRPEVQRALQGDFGKSIRESTTIHRDLLYVALPIEEIQDKKIIIRLAVNLIEINKINEVLYKYIGFSIIVGLIVSMLIGHRLIHKVLEPIKEITNISKKISEGNLDRRVKVSSNDEIGELANNFNIMASRLKNTIEALSNSNTKFKALLTSFIHPILAVDNKRNIIVINPAAEQLFKVEAKDVLGKHILEIIRNHSLDEEFKNIFLSNRESKIEVIIPEPEEKILRIHTNLITLEKNPLKTIGLVALIEDVTEIRKLEKMRSDFVANVSHELRTPLTSISGFVETLKSGEIEDEKTKQRFLDIIDIETQRLKRLIADILTLSEIENINTKLLQQDISLSESIKEVEGIMCPIAAAKQIELIFETQMELPSLKGNSDEFKQMIINLIDNAIKYTPKGGSVLISIYKKYNKIIISVKDTGIGIPKKDIPRIFERFYTVDKARNRKAGGTGLGLAIVKHIVISLNGSIRVNSDIGKGTEFIIIIPI